MGSVAVPPADSWGRRHDHPRCRSMPAHHPPETKVMPDTATTPTPETAMTVTSQPPAAPDRGFRGLAITTFDEAFRFAQMVAKTDFAPKDFRGKPEACLLALQFGAEVGLTPMQALQSVAVINGRPSIWGDAALALCQSSPVCEWVRESIVGEGDDMQAVCECKRRGDPEPRVAYFSVADAKRAGLWQTQAVVKRKNRETGQHFEAPNDSPWYRYPTRMLQLRARGFALRDAFPDVLRGLICSEEARDYAASPEPTQAAPPPRPAPKTPRLSAPDPDEPQLPAAQARLAVSRAKTIADLDSLRRRVDQRASEGVLTASEREDLIDLIHGRVEWLSAGRFVGAQA